jgi:MHS family proline/betaine transporter-like MFS transporter
VSESASREGGQGLTVDQITVTEPSVMRRAIGAAAIGNVTEWFDFGVYAYLETTIQKVFFTGASQTIATIGTLGLFAVAFLVRPFGGMFFGPLGDRIGRTKVLSLTVILMAIGTFVIALIPSYQTIGAAAPMLMLLARLLQGFSTGGEYGGAMAFIAEYAPDKRRGFLGSWLEFGTLTGYALGATMATLITSFIPEDALLSWGWRIPFLISGPLGLIGLYLRLKLEETPAFKAIAEQSESREGNQTLREIKEIFVKYWRPMVICMGLVLVFNVTNYMLTSYMPTYLEQLPGGAGIGTTASQILQIVVLLVMMVFITFLGRLSDMVGRRPVIFAGCALLIVLGVPSVLLMQQGGTGPVLGGLLMMGAMLLCFNSAMPSHLPALFPTEIRYGALAISFNISVSLFGGTTAVATAGLIALTGDQNWPGYYLMIAGVVGAIACYFARESARKPLPGSTPAVSSREEAEELVGASKS